MNLQPIVYVTDMERSVRWYSALLQIDPDVEGSHWTSFRVGGSHLALHLTDDVRASGNVELSLVATEPLESLAARFEVVGGIVDEAFGRSVMTGDPDGLQIQVNEHDPDLYRD
jgi:hypothetical protein